jgi:hypothetical protein
MSRNLIAQSSTDSSGLESKIRTTLQDNDRNRMLLRSEAVEREERIFVGCYYNSIMLDSTPIACTRSNLKCNSIWLNESGDRFKSDR